MGLLNKLFGQNNKPVSSPSEISKPAQQACKTKEELLEKYGGDALDKQMALTEVIGDKDWNVDITKGEISFGGDLVFPIQILGTFSHSSETWLWSWANIQSDLSENITKNAKTLKKYGEDNNIDVLKLGQFDATKDDLHLIGLIASGLFNASGYYIADYGQGTMVVTIKSEKIDQIRKDDHLRILTVFPQLISLFVLNHKPALSNYLAAKGYNISDNGNQLIATKNGQTITAEFDELTRLTSLNG